MQSTNSLSSDRSVGDLLREKPARARVFEEFRIDYCCGGKKSLSEACAARGLDPDAVLKRLECADAIQADPVDVDAMGLSELADHIVATHHALLREELTRLDFITRKVSAVHGEAEPRLHEIRRVFSDCRDELSAHMIKEEHVLFPMIRELEQAEGAISLHCGSLANPIRMMEHEHQNVGDALERFRVLTDDYTPPQWACNTYRAMVDALAAFEGDMHLHVHKENNILFPRALRLEADRHAAGRPVASPGPEQSHVPQTTTEQPR